MAAGTDWIERLGLAPHPEGGWFRRIYTAPGSVASPGGERPTATSIYYLLAGAQRLGRLHRNRSDILHFLIDGGPVDYLVADAGGNLHRHRLGSAGDRHLLVCGGDWKASELVDDATHALIAEVVTPGFDYADHEFASAARLRHEHPQLFSALQRFVGD